MGQGWVAEEWLAFHHQGGIPWPERPDLSDAGLMAFIGTDNGVWLMEADGSGRRQVSAPVPNEYIASPRWSPSGERLAFSISRWDGTGGTVATRIIGVDGTVLVELPGLSEPLWSPDGARLSALRVTRNGEMGGFYGTPIVHDLATGSEVVLGPETFYMSAPVWSPDGASLAFVCISGANTIYQVDGSSVEQTWDCGGDGLRIAAADGSSAYVLLPLDAQNGVYLSNPSWSPAGDAIALVNFSDTGGCRGYTLVDAATGATASCVPLPTPGGMGGRCGGSSETGASDWSLDSRYLIFHTTGSGENGVFVNDIATGQRIVIPNLMVESVTIAAGGEHLAFGGSGHIWVAGLDGSNLTLLGEGHSPAWQPQS